MSQEEKFIAFIEQYQNLILKVSSIYCGNEEERKDLMQEIILQLWKAYPKFDNSYSLTTWAYRIALNVSISYVRKTSTRNKVIQNYKREISFTPLEEHPRAEQLKLLHDSIAFLKPIDKAIISLHLEGCNNQEISDVLGMTMSNVSTRLTRIRQALKNNFTKK